MTAKSLFVAAALLPFCPSAALASHPSLLAAADSVAACSGSGNASREAGGEPCAQAARSQQFRNKQSPNKQGPKKATPKAAPASVALETWDDKTARSKVKAFTKAIKPKKASMKVRKDALDSLAGGRSAKLVKPLQKFLEKERSVTLKRQAVEMLGNQPQKQAYAAILKLLRNARVASNPQVQAGLIRALSRTGYQSDDWLVVADVIESDYDTERVPAHEALLDLVIQHKEAKAVPMLLRNFDEPLAGNVEAADNPPASYWKARWHSWAVWRGKVKQALFAISGQQFGTSKEALAWFKKNGGRRK
ncbi:MAG: hypothetical protein AB8H80_07905 [Planctomycetota bacterium]